MDGEAAHLQAGTFEEELAWLLQDWQVRLASQNERSRRGETARTLGYLPQALVAAVAAATGCSSELFASPLNVHPNMRAYCSAVERHQLFGASGDAYSCCWEGVCYAHPPAEATELERAVRWALARACEAQGRPAVTVLLVPDGPDAAAANRWLAYPEALQLAEFAPGELPCLRVERWQGESRRHVPKAGHRLFAVANPEGLAQLQDLSRSEMWNTLSSQRGTTAAPWPWRKVNGGLQYRQQQAQSAGAPPPRLHTCAGSARRAV